LSVVLCLFGSEEAHAEVGEGEFRGSAYDIAMGKQWMDRSSRFRSSALKLGMKRPEKALQDFYGHVMPNPDQASKLNWDHIAWVKSGQKYLL
ncbi:hypothetical protein ACJX0J_038030, partial [Zea mays]